MTNDECAKKLAEELARERWQTWIMLRRQSDSWEDQAETLRNDHILALCPIAARIVALEKERGEVKDAARIKIANLQTVLTKYCTCGGGSIHSGSCTACLIRYEVFDKEDV
jgi:hypothetical protein